MAGPTSFSCGNCFPNFWSRLFSCKAPPKDAVPSCLGALGQQLQACASDACTSVSNGAFWIKRQIIVFPTTLKTGCVAGALWLGHKITLVWTPFYHHVCLPTKDGLVQIGCYTREHYRAVLTHLVTWGLILVSYGALYGFHDIALKMLIGMGPGCLGGMLLGALVAKTFHQPRKGQDQSSSLFKVIERHIEAVPSWTRSLLIAVLATMHLTLCYVVPYAGGAASGAFFGAIWIYNGLRHQHTKIQEPTSAHDTDPSKHLAQQLQHLMDEVSKLQQQIFSIQPTQPSRSRESLV